MASKTRKWYSFGPEKCGCTTVPPFGVDVPRYWVEVMALGSVQHSALKGLFGLPIAHRSSQRAIAEGPMGGPCE